MAFRFSITKNNSKGGDYMNIETSVPHTSFPESRGGGTTATELPTVALAARPELDPVTLRSVDEMDAVSDRFPGRRSALELAMEAVGANRVA